ncbi:redoxin domain-containing protein [Capillimicrobium parvum]|uniref:redoxin domain-containing protein n=1 Tax=Capillimicrobium parvum TaxID=2884022 RepID=UPI00216AE928|nr:redoxin domain-containing protein [Capillimicrobium parvum]
MVFLAVWATNPSRSAHVIVRSADVIAVTHPPATINRVMAFPSRNTSRAPMQEDAARRLPVLGCATELVGVEPWFNTPDGEPLRLAALRDRVVLLEFWTFACVNCQRTIPFLRRMHGQYQPGFAVVGVHSPEFAFERSVENVERAVREHGLEYPVGLDNDFVAWNAYENRYWPTMYLIDRAGRIRYTHIGEGNYGHTEAAVRALLGEAVDPAAETKPAS